MITSIQASLEQSPQYQAYLREEADAQKRALDGLAASANAERQKIAKAYTPNGAANLYQCVNAVTPTDSTVFASDSTPGDKMSVDLASTSVTGAIAGVINIGRMKKTDAGTRTAALFALNGGTEVDGSSIALGTSYAYYQQVLEVDPNTNAPWTNSGFNTLQLGCETLT